jgi:hypothetical protein
MLDIAISQSNNDLSYRDKSNFGPFSTAQRQPETFPPGAVVSRLQFSKVLTYSDNGIASFS